MNMTRKIASVVLAMILVLCVASSAMAETTTTTISVAAGDTHTYAVYQIFTGELSGKVLSNVMWGVNGTGYVEDAETAVPADTLEDLEELVNSTNTEKLAAIEALVNWESTPVAESLTSGASVTVPTGYYLIKDITKNLGTGDTYNLFVVQIVGPTEVANKRDTVESEKKVKDINDSTGTASNWQDSADYDIGDAVPFKLSATMPENYADYEAYYMVFHDVESEGLTFAPTSVVVKVDGKVITSGYKVVTETSDGCTFEVVFEDLKKIVDEEGNQIVSAGSEITVEYTSTLNSDAKIGGEGNKNTMHLEYTNNPNWDGEGTPTTGKTPEDTVIVFTYKVIVNKKDEGGKDLVGAGFTLYKYDASVQSDDKWVKIGNELTGDEMTTFEWTGLDDGNYKLVETTTPAGYNTIAPIEFTITAEHSIEAAEPTLTKLEGNGFTANLSNGSLTTDVINQTGSTLPETGGMGTTMIYIVGGVLVLAALLLLVTKRRVGTEK